MGNDGMDGRRCYVEELKEDAGVSMCKGICIGLRGQAREEKGGQNIWRAMLLSLLPAWCLCLGSQVVEVVVCLLPCAEEEQQLLGGALTCCLV